MARRRAIPQVNMTKSTSRTMSANKRKAVAGMVARGQAARTKKRRASGY